MSMPERRRPVGTSDSGGVTQAGTVGWEPLREPAPDRRTDVQEDAGMMTIACPWCDEDAELSLAAFTSTESLVCVSCGTTVHLTEEPNERLDLAA